MEVDNIDVALTQETQVFVDRIKEMYEDIIAEKDAEIEEKDAEIEALKEELEERKGRCCPKGYEADTSAYVYDTSSGDSNYERYKKTHTRRYDKIISFVKRDKRSHEIYMKKTASKKGYYVIHSKKGIPVGKTLFNYINDHLQEKYTATEFDHYYNRFFFKKEIFDKAIEDIKVLMENFQDKK